MKTEDITVEFLNSIPGRPCLMLPWRVNENAKNDFHYLECVGDGLDLGTDFEVVVCWLEGQSPTLYARLPDLGPGCPIWDELVDYARAIHRALDL